MNNVTSHDGNNNSQIPKASKKIYYSPSTIGLFIGILSFFMAIFSAFGKGLCNNILLSAGVGAFTGWLTISYSDINVTINPSESGGKAGLIAGSFIFLGTIVGGILPILMLRASSELGIITNPSIFGPTDLTSGFIRGWIVNGIIGLIIAWNVAAAVASKVYGNNKKQNLT